MHCFINIFNSSRENETWLVLDTTTFFIYLINVSVAGQ